MFFTGKQIFLSRHINFIVANKIRTVNLRHFLTLFVVHLECHCTVLTKVGQQISTHLIQKRSCAMRQDIMIHDTVHQTTFSSLLFKSRHISIINGWHAYSWTVSKRLWCTVSFQRGVNPFSGTSRKGCICYLHLWWMNTEVLNFVHHKIWYVRFPNIPVYSD
jgi:hypothetical protein